MAAYVIYLLGEFVVRALPRSWAYRLSDFLSDLYYLFRKGCREAVEANLRQVRGEHVPAQELRSLTRQVFRNFGRAVTDFLGFGSLSAEDLDDILRIEGLAEVKELAARGKGVIIVTAHFGNWELGGAVLALRGHPLTVPALDHASARVTRYFTRQREAQGMHVVPLGRGARAAVTRALERGEFVGVLGDLALGARGVEVELCGRPTRVPAGYLEVAVARGAYVVPAFVIRREGRRHEAVFEPALSPPPEGPPEGQVAALAGEWARVLEKHLRRHPEQWTLFHRAWQD